MHILWEDLDEDTKWEQYERYVDEAYRNCGDSDYVMTYAEYEDARQGYCGGI